MAAIGVISASLCAPALPFIADHFNAHFSSVQFTISLFLVGNAFGQFLSGPLSDQIGQRLVLLGGLLLYIIASCGCALADQMALLLTARFFQGMGSAVGPVLARAIATNQFSPEKSAQVQSYGAMGVGVASILAILSSGQITLVSWRGNFWLATALGGLLFFWAMATLKKAPLAPQPASLKQLFAQMKQVFIHPHFLGSAICHSITYGLMYGYIALFPFLLIEIFHEKNPSQVGLYSALMIAFYMLGAFFASRFVFRWTQNRLIAIGLLLQLISGAWLAFTSSPLTALCMFNISIGIILPLTSATALAPFKGYAVGSASSTLGLTYRLIGSGLSMLICRFPIAGGKNLGLAILLFSAGSFAFFRWMASRFIRVNV